MAHIYYHSSKWAKHYYRHAVVEGNLNIWLHQDAQSVMNSCWVWAMIISLQNEIMAIHFVSRVSIN